MKVPVLEIPPPESLRLTDPLTRTLNLRAVVIGSGADDYLGALRDATSLLPEQDRSLAPRAPLPGAAKFSYLSLIMDEVHGWKVMVHFYAFGIAPEPRLALARQRHAMQVEGLLLAERQREAGADTAAIGGGHRDADDDDGHDEDDEEVEDSALQLLAAALHEGRGRMPVVVFGSDAYARRWACCGGWEPVHVAAPGTRSVLHSVQQMIRAILIDLRHRARRRQDRVVLPS